MSAHKDLLHEAVTTWLIVEGLDDTPENYEAGITAIMEPHALNAALHQIALHDAANRDFATMTDECRTAVLALADELARNFEEVWVETVQQSRQLPRS